MKEMDMTGGVALVTGGAGGIGRAACLEFARAGAKVVVVDIDAEGAERTAAEIRALGGQALATRADVSKTAEVQAYVKLTVDTFGR
ncbi:MAG TPA: SDR family NAD(P)-dependent oxidoreductase, partial [Thermoflexales bacterium]|nr:SDR family NAD(P)-dependent oxidoreductase [Thermoflexales bacterium]